MPTYQVKTYRNRHLVIDADRFTFNEDSKSYDFYKKTKIVASVPRTDEVFSVVRTDCSVADLYFSIVGKQIDFPSPAPKQYTDIPKQEVPKVEYRMYTDGNHDVTYWGFVAEDKFVPFPSKEEAEQGAVDWANGDRDFEVVPLEITTEIPGVIN